MTDHQWLLFELPTLLAKIEPGSPRFKEVLRTPSLSCSIYHLPAGSTQMQSAHEEDELYLVLEGRARLRGGAEDQLVQKGSIMYVHTACDHAFFDIEEDLTVLAFFGTPLRLAQRGNGMQADPDLL